LIIWQPVIDTEYVFCGFFFPHCLKKYFSQVIDWTSVSITGWRRRQTWQLCTQRRFIKRCLYTILFTSSTQGISIVSTQF